MMGEKPRVVGWLVPESANLLYAGTDIGYCKMGGLERDVAAFIVICKTWRGCCPSK